MFRLPGMARIGAFSVAVLLAVLGLAEAQTPTLGPPAPTGVNPVSTEAEKAALKTRIDQLEKQAQDLIDAVKARQAQQTPADISTDNVPPGLDTTALSPLNVQQLVNAYLAEKEQTHQTAEHAKSAEGYKVGTDLGMTAFWKNGLYLETANKDFWFHMGSRFQFDNDFFHQSQILKNKAPLGVGQYLDGDYYRRIRPLMQGGFWEVGEFNIELQLENIANGVSGLDDVWVGVNDVPLFGSIRAGHFHLPHGLEPDMYSSSRAGIFLERYSGNAAFLDQRSSGVLFTNAFFDQRMTYAAMVFRPDNANNGEDFANGDYAGIARLTFLPIYENEGRCLLHVGGAVTWKHARTGTVNFGAGPQINDFAGGDNAYGSPVAVTTVVNNAAPASLNTPVTATSTVSGFKPAPGNSSQWVSTGAVLANSSTVFGGEFLYINGPFSLQAEYDWAFMDNATVGGASQGNLGFTAGYVQLSYILTGENRLYNTKLGRLPRDYLSPVNQPFWLVRGENGKFDWGIGSWEIAARVSRIDLNSGPIKGGIMDNAEAALNWVPNQNLRIQFVYIHTDRFALPSNASGGWLNSLGIRTQLMF